MAQARSGYGSNMEQSRQQALVRRELRRRALLRRMLMHGTIAGFLLGAVSVVMLGTSDDDIVWLIRAALFVPAAVCGSWWLVATVAHRRDRLDGALDAVDADGPRAERIESVFDTAAVPGARRHSDLEGVDDATRSLLRGSVRRSPSGDVDDAARSYGLGGPSAGGPEAEAR
jgi:hypothetical protein